jgi:hypothetical protein
VGLRNIAARPLRIFAPAALLRAQHHAGALAWPRAEAYLIDRPDEFGRSAMSVVVVK